MKKRILMMSLVLATALFSFTDVHGLRPELFVNTQDGFTPFGLVATGGIGNGCYDNLVAGGTTKTWCNPTLGYSKMYFGKGLLGKNNSKRQFRLKKDDLGRVVVTDFAGSVDTADEMFDNNNTTENVPDPGSPYSNIIIENQKVTFRPIDWAEKKKKKMYRKKVDPKCNEFVGKCDWQVHKLIKSGKTKSMGNTRDYLGKYCSSKEDCGAFMLTMSSRLHPGVGQKSFGIHGKFNKLGGFTKGSEEIDFYSFWQDRFDEKTGLSAITVTGNKVFFDSKFNGTLTELQQGYRPQLIWSLPFIKIHIKGSGPIMVFKTQLYDTRVGENLKLRTTKSKGQYYTDEEQAKHYGAGNAYSVYADYQGYSGTGLNFNIPGTNGIYPDPSCIGKSSTEECANGKGTGISFLNTVYRLGAGVAPGLDNHVYSSDNRYSYFNDIGFCGDGLIQKEFGEKCDDGVANGNTCSFECQPQETLCGNGVVDPFIDPLTGVIDKEKSEECDWKALEGKPVITEILGVWAKGQESRTYTGTDNPCYSNTEEGLKEAAEAGKKPCQWKKPPGKIELMMKDKRIADVGDKRDMVLSELPIWASIMSYEYFTKNDIKGMPLEKVYTFPKPFEFPMITMEVPNKDDNNSIKGLDGKYVFNLSGTYNQKKGGSVIKRDAKEDWMKYVETKLGKNKEELFVGSIIFNNVAAKAGVLVGKNDITSFVTDLPKIKKEESKDIDCKLISNGQGENEYKVTLVTKGDDDTIIEGGKVDVKLTNKKGNNPSDLYSGTISESNGKELDVKINKTSKVVMNVEYTGTDGKTEKKECSIRLKAVGNVCIDNMTDHNGKPQKSTVYDSNIGIYSF